MIILIINNHKYRFIKNRKSFRMNIRPYVLTILGFPFAKTGMIMRIFLPIFFSTTFLRWLIGDWKDSVDAVSKFGNLFLGIAALYGVNVFASEIVKKRSDAAAFILAKIRKRISKVIQIAEYCALYQYANYGKLYSEGTADENVAHPEMPSRMIEEKATQLKSELYEPSAQLKLLTAEEVYGIVDEIRKEAKSLGIAVSEWLKDPKYANTIESNRLTLAKYHSRLQKLEERAKSLLAPIIERGE